MANLKGFFFDEAGVLQRVRARLARYLTGEPADATDKANIRSAIGVADMVGATALAAGAAGRVPQPAAGDNGKFLNGAGEWVAAAGGGDMFAGNKLAEFDTDAKRKDARANIKVYSRDEVIERAGSRARWGGLRFDGVTDGKLRIPDNDLLTLPDNALSIGCWFLSEDWDKGTQYLLTKLAATPNAEFYLLLTAAGKVEARLYDSGDTANRTTFTTDAAVYASDFQLHHVLFTWDGTTGKIYIDGVSVDVTASDSGTGFSAFSNGTQP